MFALALCRTAVRWFFVCRLSWSCNWIGCWVSWCWESSCCWGEFDGRLTSRMVVVDGCSFGLALQGVGSCDKYLPLWRILWPSCVGSTFPRYHIHKCKVYLSVCQSVCLHLDPSISPSVSSLCPSARLSIHWSTCPSLSLCLSNICLFCILACPLLYFISLPVHPSARPLVYLPFSFSLSSYPRLSIK